jgi:hypothetical protein
MENRRYSSETIYPFVPAALGYKAYVKGIIDCFLVVNGTAAATPVATIPYLKLMSMAVTTMTNTYTFQAVCHDGARSVTFSVPRGSGIVRVTSGFSTLVINSDTMYDVNGTYSLAAEVEPARVCWQVDEVTAVNLVNERRMYDPSSRDSLPCTTLVSYQADGNIIKLVDGYNCELSYDEGSETLFINAAAGLGKGLPTTTPWSTSPPDVENGIKTVNGINNNGNVDIKPGNSLTMALAPCKITLTVSEDPEK